MFFRFDPARLITKCLLCGFAAITVIVCIGALFPNKGDAAPQRKPSSLCRAKTTASKPCQQIGA